MTIGQPVRYFDANGDARPGVVFGLHRDDSKVLDIAYDAPLDFDGVKRVLALTVPAYSATAPSVGNYWLPV